MKIKICFAVMMVILGLLLSACSIRQDGSINESESEASGWAAVTEDSAKMKIPVLEIEPVERTQYNVEKQEDKVEQIGFLKEEQEQNTNVEESIREEQIVEGYMPQEGIKELKGYQYGADGENIPVTILFYVVDVIRGEDAKQALAENDIELPQLGEGEEYIVITLNVTYVDGGAETLFFAENIASMASANLSFALQNGNSNAVNITTYLNNNIHDFEINRGESVEGKVAFIHNVNENGSLVFHGFDNIVEFDILK